MDSDNEHCSSRFSTPSLSSPYNDDSTIAITKTPTAPITSQTTASKTTVATMIASRDKAYDSTCSKKRKHTDIGSNTNFDKTKTNSTENGGCNNAELDKNYPQKDNANNNNSNNNDNSISSNNKNNNNNSNKTDKKVGEEQLNENEEIIVKYEINEKVYVREKNQVYLAKILKTRFGKPKSLSAASKRKSKLHPQQQQHQQQLLLLQQQQQQQQQQHKPFWEYYIHFNGWSARHDKWCHEEYIMKEDDIEGRKLADISTQRLKNVALEQKEKKEKKERKVKEVKDRMKRKKNGGKKGGSAGAGSDATDYMDDNSVSTNTTTSNAKASTSTNANTTNIKEMYQSLDKSFVECCELPFTLQTVLVDDKNKITRLGRFVAEGHDRNYHYANHDQNNVNTDNNDNTCTWSSPRMVHKLPATISVETILKQFVKSKIKQLDKTYRKDKDDNDHGIDNDHGNDNMKNEKQQIIKNYKSFHREISHLFDTMLPKCLLYEGERKQFEILWDKEEEKQKVQQQTEQQQLPMSQIYSGEFLLRFLVRLPMIITIIDKASSSSSTVFESTNIDSSDMGSLLVQWKKFYHQDNQSVGTGRHISELILFLQKNKNHCFKGKYRTINVDEYNDSEKLHLLKLKKKRKMT